MSYLPIRPANSANRPIQQPMGPVTARNSNSHHFNLPPNPRRRPAKDAVSLKHTRRNNAQQNTNTTRTSTPSQPSSLAANRDSSGEASNVEQWFDKSNQNVRQNQNVTNESPPFFFQNSSTDSSNEHGGYANTRPVTNPTLTTKDTNVITSSGSSSEEYRSVIDDLTIQNQRLRSRLKKYERMHNPHLESERLFEVKMYGLSAEKKRELEETLRTFATSLNQTHASRHTQSTNSSYPLQAQDSKRPESSPSSGMKGQEFLYGSQATKPTSSMSSARVADSGYGSITTFGPSAHSSGIQSQQQQQQQPPLYNMNSYTPSNNAATGSSNSRNSNIKSYLLDIPEGLLPNLPQAMTEHARKKTVVRRLEQIFGGRVALPGDHQHPMQQQEVSQSAAKADRTALEAQGRRVAAEGMREAHIMDNETEEPMDLSNDKSDNSPDNGASNSGGPKDRVNEQDHANSRDLQPTGLEQRPTRPLDLDPDRAQMPAENINYLRHLGFSLTDLESDPHAVVPDRENWVYLNLLMNMAQLHTINVTTEFVKSALTEYSSKLELSGDGRKVRWKGGSDVTRFSSLNGSAQSTPYSNTDGQTPSGSHNRKRTHSDRLQREDSFASRSSHTSRKRAKSLDAPDDKFSYKPLFKHRDDDDSEFSEDDDNDLIGHDDNAVNGPSTVREASMLNHARSGTGSAPIYPGAAAKRWNDGPIIFYSNALFCTDLSGDAHHPAPTKQTPRPPVEFETFTNLPIGAIDNAAALHATYLSTFELRPLLTTKTSSADPEAMMVGEKRVTLSTGLPRFVSDSSSGKSVTFADQERIIEFEASGIGGVIPSDNISIKVTREQKARVLAPGESSSPTMQQRRLRSLAASTRVAALLPLKEPRFSSKTRISETILSARAIHLSPSPLPPATYAMMDDEYDSNVDAESDADSDDDESSDNGGTRDAVAGTLPANFGTRSMELDSEDSNEYESEESDDDSGEDPNQAVDFLAMARSVDPETIRAKEREYDAEMAERLAEEIPAGSSAATAGGGSGFTSPAGIFNKMSNESQQLLLQQKQQKKANRANTEKEVAAARIDNEEQDDDEVEDGSVSS